MRRFAAAALALALAAAPSTAPTAGLELTVDAPPALAAAAERVRAVDVARLRASLAAAGLDVPPNVHVTLVPEDDPRAQDAPSWIAGRARWPREVEIFPQRADRGFPFQSIESIVWHEIAHLALTTRAGGRPLPRWFHEGVAMSIEGGWDVSRSVRLLFATLNEPAILDVTRLFESEAQPATGLAYLLAGALVADMRETHGPGAPGAIAARVAADVPFDRAFQQETGETPDEAAARTWRAHRRWTVWLSSLTSPGAIWSVILALACAAFVARLFQRARQRRRWEEEERKF